MVSDFKRGYITHKLRARNYVSLLLQKQRFLRVLIPSILLLLISAIVIPSFLVSNDYTVTGGEKLLPAKNSTVAKNISYDLVSSNFNFSLPKNADGAQKGIEATLNKDISKGVEVTDVVNDISFTLTPLDKHEEGKQDSNRIVYPLKNHDGWTVYTIQNSGVKEDIILESSTKDILTF